MTTSRPVALFLDFDNTITRGDVLDRVIERFSASDAWRGWESEWQAGRMQTVECLQRQVGDLRAPLARIVEFVGDVEVDPGFARIVAWAEANGHSLEVLSDNFRPLIEAILSRQGLARVPLFANELDSDGERHVARFPLRDPHCARCAHCKGMHVRAPREATRIFVGDGLSDVCGALAADQVFAKDSLATALDARGVPFVRYAALAEVEEALRSQFPGS